jgi:hypothetical protein
MTVSHARGNGANRLNLICASRIAVIGNPLKNSLVINKNYFNIIIFLEIELSCAVFFS